MGEQGAPAHDRRAAGDGPWLGLSAPEAEALARRGTLRAFGRGEALCHAGQVADRVLLLRSGRVKVSAATTSGREIVLAFRGPGELVGELAALDGAPRSATVVALEPVETLVLTHEAFDAFLEEHPRVLRVLVQVLVERLRDADAKRVEFAAFDTLGRVAIRLLELCDRFGDVAGDHIDVQLPLSQEELAGWSGASLESVTRALQTMRTLGWIETSRRRIRVLDADALRGAAT